MTKAALSRAEVPIYLADIDDEGRVVGELELYIRALSDKQIDELDEWLRVEYLRNVRRSLKADSDITPAEYDAEMGLAHSMAASLTWMSGRGAEMMSTPKGMAKLIHTHTVKCDRTVDELRSLMFHPENVLTINKAIESVNISDFKQLKLKALAAKAKEERDAKSKGKGLAAKKKRQKERKKRRKNKKRK